MKTNNRPVRVVHIAMTTRGGGLNRGSIFRPTQCPQWLLTAATSLELCRPGDKLTRCIDFPSRKAKKITQSHSFVC